MTTTTEIVAAASEFLSDSGYVQVDQLPDGFQSNVRVFEDGFGVVAIAVFDTVDELLGSWPDVQESFVNLMSRTIGAAEAKAWDGYLVLLTPSVVESTRSAELDRVRTDVTWVRKLVATGGELDGADSVDRVLRPLAPFGRLPTLERSPSTLDDAIAVLSDTSVGASRAAALLAAYRSGSALMPALSMEDD